MPIAGVDGNDSRKAIIIGGGPCGLSAAIHLKQIGIDALVIEKAMSLTAFTITRRIKPFSAQVKSLKSETWHLLRKTESLSEFRLCRITGSGQAENIRVNAFEMVHKVTKAENNTFVIETSKELTRRHIVLLQQAIMIIQTI